MEFPRNTAPKKVDGTIKRLNVNDPKVKQAALVAVQQINRQNGCHSPLVKIDGAWVQVDKKSTKRYVMDIDMGKGVSVRAAVSQPRAAAVLSDEPVYQLELWEPTNKKFGGGYAIPY